MHRRGGLIPPPLDQSRQRVDGPVINVQVNAGNLSSAVAIWRSSFRAVPRHFSALHRGSPRDTRSRPEIRGGRADRVKSVEITGTVSRAHVRVTGGGRPNVEYRRESINSPANNQQFVPQRPSREPGAGGCF